jgi:hypothetical protein
MFLSTEQPLDWNIAVDHNFSGLNLTCLGQIGAKTHTCHNVFELFFQKRSVLTKPFEDTASVQTCGKSGHSSISLLAGL